MGKIYLLILGFLAFGEIAIGQYTWTGANSTDYQDASNWSPNRATPGVSDVLTFNVASPVMVTNVAGETIGAIEVTGGTSSVTFTANSPFNVLNLGASIPLIYTTAGTILAGDVLTIRLSNPSPFTISSGTFGISPSTGGKISITGSLILAGGKLDLDVTGTGGTTITASGSITNNSGIFSCTTTSSISWLNGSNYYHNTTGAAASAIPAATWLAGSTCNITGLNAGVIAPTGLTGIDFANFTWNCASQFGNVDLLPAASSVSIFGSLNVTSTGTKELRISTAGKASIKTYNYTQSAGTVLLQAAAASDTTTLTVSGTFSHTGGTLNAVGLASPGTAIIDFFGNVTRGTAATWQSNSTSPASQFILQFSGSTTQNVDVSAGTPAFPSQSRCNIVNNNTDVINGISVTGILRVVNGNSAILPATFTMNGKISGGGGVTYTGAGAGGTSLIYTSSSFQTASGIEFPVSNGPSNLIVSNTLGLGFPASFSRTIPGRLTMISGNLAIGAGNILTLSNAVLGSQLTYTGGYITTGTLGRAFPTTGLPTDTSDTRSLFPFGSGTNNRSLRLYFSSSNLSGGTAGTIFVTHTPVVGVAAISPNIADNGINLDKRTTTYWNVGTSASTFNLGGGGETISLSVVAANIGAVDDYTKLRLTDGATGYGTLINSNTGTNQVPATGKRLLQMSDLNKPLYIGSDGTTVYNPLIIITFNWTGLGGNTAWTNPNNWSGIGAVGYPSASTEIANILTTSGTQPTINSVDNINVFQLTVNSGMTLTMAGNAVLNVYDAVSFGGTAVFDPTSTFGYASSNASQTLLSLPYGNLSVSGTAGKVLPATITVTGNYTISGATPTFTSNLFTYAGAGAQRITATTYDNLTITGNRGGALITLGTATSANTIDIKSVFDVSALSNFSSKVDFNTVNFSSTGSQAIPGFTYSKITQTGGGARVLDPLGSTDPNHVITCLTLAQPASCTVTNSKVRFVVSGTTTTSYTTASYHDLELSGDLKGIYGLDFTSSAYIKIAGKFSVTATNYKLAKNPFRFEFNGTGDQTIPAFKTNTATNTPAFKYCNIFIPGGNRNVTFEGTDTIGITGSLNAEAIPGPPYTSPFAAGKGFIVAGSTIVFDTSSSVIPVLKPAVAGSPNYNNIFVSSGTWLIGGDMTIGGDVTVKGTDISSATLAVGNGNTPRIVNMLGNLAIGGTGGGTKVTGQLDLNTGTNGTTRVNLAGNLSIDGYGQLMGTTSDNASNGLVVFNGSTPQTYSNTDLTFKNGLVNFVVGDGTLASTLTLASSMTLLANNGTLSPNRDSLTVANNSSLDCGTKNITSFSAGTGNVVFNLQAGATLITANTGGIEGTATSASTGSIISGATIVKTYSPTASYVFNASTTTPFPAAITPMANLTIGVSANVSLNKSIEASNTLTLRNSSLLQLLNNYFNLRSTASATARVATVPASASITYGSTGRFVVERYYPSRRAWRLMTAPVTADPTRTVFDSWQMGGAPTTTGEGTFVSGPGANPTANGLDVSPLNNFSLKIGNALTGVTNTKTQLISGTAGVPGVPDNLGMFLFVRGDRSTPNLFNPPFSNTTVLRDTGKIQIHTQTMTLTGPAPTLTTGFELVGNPFPSQVDMNAVMASSTGINTTTFYVYDPYLNAEQGGYITMQYNGTVYVPTPSPTPGGLTSTIQSSQALYVQRTSTTSTLIFAETSKTGSTTYGQFRPASIASTFRTNLYQVNSDNSSTLADGLMVRFDDDYSDGVDFDDALKFGNVKETFGLMRDNKMIAVESRPTIQAEDTLFFKLTKSTQRDYKFEFVPDHLDPLVTAYLEDKYTGIKTPLILTGKSSFSFTVNGDAASAATDRFRIVFKKKDAAPLPITYSSIKAYQKSTDIAVDWTVENELNIVKYEVEKSVDGVNFDKVNTTSAKGGSNSSITYSFLDVNAVQGNNFYRIVSYNKIGVVEYSRIVVIKIGKTGTGISIYPNPVKGNTIGVSFNNMEKGLYNVKLINTIGQALMTQKINHAAGSSMETLTPGSTLAAGIYQLEITAPGKRISTIKVIVQ